MLCSLICQFAQYVRTIPIFSLFLGCYAGPMTGKRFDGKSRRAGETLASSTYGQLRRDIIHGAIAPGSKLRIRQLAAHYAVGFTPIREALNRLSRDGLVRQSDLRGFATAPLTAEELDELTKTRCWLNELAQRQAIEHGDSAWEEEIVLAYFRLSRVPMWVPPEEPANGAINPEWEIAHRNFHAALIAACGSSWLLGFCEQLFDVADRYRVLSRGPAMRQRRDEDEHRPIMEAAIARDSERAVELLKRHFLRTAELGQRALQSRNVSAAAGRDANPRASRKQRE
jgi:GntR family carbon starvation induced transcriptional regulator